MRFEVKNQIVVYEPTKVLFEYCKKLVLLNPEYVKRERMGLWTGSTPRKLYLCKYDGDNVFIPTGCVDELFKLSFFGASWTDARTKGAPFEYGSQIALYDYQEEAVKYAMLWGGGILVAPCGSGKTQMGLELVARLGVKTLWLTHTADLLNQSMSRAKEVFSCEKGYGKITEGKVQVGEGLTFATVQTMAKLDLTEYRDTWGCVIVDECHHCVGSPTKVGQFYRVLSNLNARYKYGLTATPKRADGLETAMFALLGNIAHEVPRSAVEGNTCPVKVQVICTGWMPSPGKSFLGDGTLDYNGIVDDMTTSESRMDVVLQVIIQRIPKGEPVLILGNRIAYLERLQERLTGLGLRCRCISGMRKSKAAKDERKEALAALDRGDIDCLLATYQLAKEGLDCPHLRHVVFATPEKDPTTIQQAAGRVARKAEGKPQGVVWDIVDTFPMYWNWGNKRQNIYKKLGYYIVDF